MSINNEDAELSFQNKKKEDVFKFTTSDDDSDDFDNNDQIDSEDFRPYASKERMSVIKSLDDDLVVEYGAPLSGLSKRKRQEILFLSPVNLKVNSPSPCLKNWFEQRQSLTTTGQTDKWRN